MSFTSLYGQGEYFVKDFRTDNYPGISLLKAYNYLGNSKGKSIVIAVIDTDIDINHPDLREKVWVNSDEIRNNGIDDDNNGYIDDVHGWNFLMNEKGVRQLYTTESTVKFIQYYENLDSLSQSDGLLKKKYISAIAANRTKNEELDNDKETMTYVKNEYPRAKKSVDSLLRNKNYSLNTLDSLRTSSTLDSVLKARADFMYIFTNLDYDIAYVEEYLRITKIEKEIIHNTSYELDRASLKDDVHNLSDVNYGYHIVNSNLDVLTHGTTVTGVLTNFKNIKYMPISIQTKYGAEAEKDVALAIKYAVDNGADIINYSATYKYSIHDDWVVDAIDYAKSKNVLIVKSAGNSGVNLDVIENKNYPMSSNDNFITVGATGKKVDSTLVPYWSNYGKNSVDLFAPGEDIRTISTEGFYEDSGTSLSAPLVCGVAAMIMSHYPKLKPKEIKECILQSVDNYDVEVKNESLTLQFNQMSKSGGVLNAYKAIKIAEKMSKSKN